MTTPPSRPSGRAPLCDVAIIGMACTYPGARTAARFWQNIVRKVDAVTDVPADRWPLELAADPTAGVDAVPCRKGGWLESSFAFNPLHYGIMPAALEGAEPDHFLVLRTAYEALEDAGYVEKDLDDRRVSVILGKGNYLGPGTTGLVYRGSVSEQALALVKSLYPDWAPEDIQRLKEILRRGLPRLSAEAAGGLIPNICTGRVANRLNFTGRNFTVDGACASSLIATELGVQGLSSGLDDLVLVGGVHVVTHLGFLQVFDAMHALSQGKRIRPFDERCDGTLVGEGIGMLVLKRLDEAERDGDRVYAVIKSVGTSSDGRAKSVTAPRVEGEQLALRRAYEACGLAPQTVGLIEGHGTGTSVGDAAEIETLRQVFGPNERGWPTCAVGSIKSMIGHTMPAAGAAGLIKAALALHHRVLPPTLHCDSPRRAISEGDSPFYVNGETRPWIHPAKGTPRRAGVNAFGFGGVNAHVVLEEYTGGRELDRPTMLREWEQEVVVVEADTREALPGVLERLRAYVSQVEGVELRDIAHTLNSSLDEPAGPGPAPGGRRVAFVASSLADLGQKLATAAARLADPGCTQIKDKQGIFFFGSDAIANRKVALLFPGEGSQYPNMLSELCLHFPQVREAFDLADSLRRDSHRPPPSTFIFPVAGSNGAAANGTAANGTASGGTGSIDAAKESSGDHLWTIDRATEAVLTADIAAFRLVSALGLQPDMMAGHSGGEWIALAAAGVLDMNELIGSMNRLSSMYRQAADDVGIPRMAMLAVGAGWERVERLLTSLGRRAHVANDNCAHQVIIAVETQDEAAILEEIAQHGIFVEKLPYDRGYHTPAFTYMSAPLHEYFSRLTIRPAHVPLYSCATTRLYPAGREQVLDLASTTYARPLLFRQTIEAMYEAGARIFVEAGPRGNLSAFVDDILRGRPHVTVPIDQFRRPGLTTLSYALGLLAAAGVPLDFEPLYARRMTRMLTFDAAQDSRPDEDRLPGTLRLSTCYPTLTMPEPADALPAPAAARHDSAPARSHNGQHDGQHDAAHGPHDGAHGGVQNGERQNGRLAPIEVDLLDDDPATWDVPDDEIDEAVVHGGMVFAPGFDERMHASGDLERVLQDHVALMGEFLDLHETVLTRSLRTLTPSPSLRAGRGSPAPYIPAIDTFLPPGAAESSSLPSLGPSSAASAVLPSSQPSEPMPPVSPAPPPSARESRDEGEDPSGLLLQVVSDRTGYPVDMLGLDLDLEADLGIDSIKKVEIFATLGEASRQAGRPARIEMEEIAAFKTLRQIQTRLIDGAGDAPAAMNGHGSAARATDRPGASETNGHASATNGHAAAAESAPAVHGAPAAHGVPAAFGVPAPPDDRAAAPTNGHEQPAARSAPAPVLARMPGPSLDQPLIRTATVVEHEDGHAVTLYCRIDRGEHRYLDDHALIFETPDRRDRDSRLLSMPLTGTLEIMAEAAAVLRPAMQVVGATGVRTPQAIHVETDVGYVDLFVSATTLDDDRVRVTVRRRGTAATDAPASPALAGELLAEATILLAESFPVQPPRVPLTLVNPREPVCRTGAEIYRQHHLFHGPRFQGIRDVALVGDNGLAGHLSVLPHEDVLRSDRRPVFHFDPFLLDAAGQMVGYWPVEYLDRGFIVLPIQLDEVTRYAETPAPGAAVTCELAIRDVSQRDMRVDIDLIAPDGRLFLRIAGWRDWRFFWSQQLYDFWRFPERESIGRHVAVPALESRSIVCRLVQPLSEPDRTGLWAEIWTRMILSRRERQAGESAAPEPSTPSMPSAAPAASAPPHPTASSASAGLRARDAATARLQRLVQLAAAKDAVRAWLEEHDGPHLHPADVEVPIDGTGRAVTGRWTGLSSTGLQVAICGDDQMAVAAAGLQDVAIWFERLGTERAIEASDAFLSAADRDLIRRATDPGAGERDSLRLAAACAKQAAARLLPAVTITLTGVRGDGEMQLSTGDHVVTAYTVRDQDVVIAVACLESWESPKEHRHD